MRRLGLRETVGVSACGSQPRSGTMWGTARREYARLPGARLTGDEAFGSHPRKARPALTNRRNGALRDDTCTPTGYTADKDVASRGAPYPRFSRRRLWAARCLNGVGNRKFSLPSTGREARGARATRAGWGDSINFAQELPPPRLTSFGDPPRKGEGKEVSVRVDIHGPPCAFPRDFKGESLPHASLPLP
jgi:hypothetical protein